MKTLVKIDIDKVKAGIVIVLLELVYRPLTIRNCMLLINRKLSKSGLTKLTKDERSKVLVTISRNGLFIMTNDKIFLSPRGCLGAASILREYHNYIASMN